MRDPLPIVLIEIDGNSRLRVLRHEGVWVALIDRRIDPHLVLLPERHQPLQIHETVRELPIVTLREDDAARTAHYAIDRLERGEIIVAGFGGRDV